jgi:hypothetical protein
MRLVEEGNLYSGNSEAADREGGWKAILEKILAVGVIEKKGGDSGEKPSGRRETFNGS